ncbi:MAG: Zn-dependent exopeptidase M28 [Flavobacteriales bacterium]|nr:Zn-dependent exopeptidase M28 [Flavobacteriales bacterium]
MIRVLGSIALILISALAHAQWLNQRIISELSKTRSLIPHLEKFQELGIKENGSQALEHTGNWLFSELESYGIRTVYDSFLHPSGKWHRNIIAEIPGSGSDLIVLGAHYDTRNGPGVDDNGSGISVLLEIARIMRTLSPSSSIRFMCFSAEEDGFWGSKHVVESITAADASRLKFMFNLDQIGGFKGAADSDKIFCERDEGNTTPLNDQKSARITDTLARMFELYTTLTPVRSRAYSSDYIPFEAAGFAITGLYESTDNPYTHSIRDSLTYLDSGYLNEALKGCLAAMMHFAGVPGVLSNRFEHSSNVHYYAVENGMIRLGDQKISIFNSVGIEQPVIRNGRSLTVSHLTPGWYWLWLNDGNETRLGRFHVIGN